MVAADNDLKFEALLEYLRRSHGFDFTGYKRTSLMRRVSKRMEIAGVHDYGDYADFLQVHPEEFVQLFNTILINVTNFFRDAPAWDFLAGEVLPKLLASRTALRVWCAGVASGEEAYTIAMLLAQAMGTQDLVDRVKIYATDVDEEALDQARQASYSPESVKVVPEELRTRYFEWSGNRYLFRADLRRAVIFGRHDLIQDAPISRLDLLICRNTLMYFNIETQSRILGRFHFAVNEDGYLFLGKAEMLLTHANLFSPFDLRYRVFVKVPQNGARERAALIGQSDEVNLNQRLANHLRLRESAFESSPTAQIVVDLNGVLVVVNNRARTLLGLGLQDVGRPFGDLEVSHRPVELRSHMEQVYAERHPVLIADVERRLPNEARQFLDVEVIPIEDSDGTLIGITASYADVTRRHELQDDVRRSKQDLETAYEELRSANEELETTNVELRKRTGDLNDSNALLSSILGSLRAGVVVVDRAFTVVAWNRAAEELWGLRADQVQGQPFFSLDIGLPVDQIAVAIRSRLNSASNNDTLSLPATNRRGKAITCRVTCGPLTGPLGERRGVIMLMEEENPAE